MIQIQIQVWHIFAAFALGGGFLLLGGVVFSAAVYFTKREYYEVPQVFGGKDEDIGGDDGLNIRADRWNEMDAARAIGAEADEAIPAEERKRQEQVRAAKIKKRNERNARMQADIPNIHQTLADGQAEEMEDGLETG